MTQGPACSICCGAGTIYRNYFVELKEQIGQSANKQVDCLSTIGLHFRNAERELWRMQNGYCFPTAAGLAQIESELSAMSDDELDAVRGKLRVGVQARTAVTTSDSKHLVTQVFCSALPVAYSDLPTASWNLFPKLILDATYEATFSLAVQNMAETGCNNLFLTLVGGGVFGNRLEWIFSAIERAFEIFSDRSLNAHIVSYGRSNEAVAELARRLSQ